MDTLRRAVVPARLALLGIAVMIVDVWIGRFDAVNDVVGALILVVGAYRLGALSVTPSYRAGMVIVRGMATWSFVAVLLRELRWGPPSWWGWLELGTAFFELLALVVGTLCLRLLCVTAGAREAAQGWRTSAWLFAVLVAAPVMLSRVTVTLFHRWVLTEAWQYWCVVGAMAVPLAHAFAVTRRMAR
jgi:hypothetical protein